MQVWKLCLILQRYPQGPSLGSNTTWCPLSPASLLFHMASMSAADCQFSHHGCKRNCKGEILISILRDRIHRRGMAQGMKPFECFLMAKFMTVFLQWFNTIWIHLINVVSSRVSRNRTVLKKNTPQSQ